MSLLEALVVLILAPFAFAGGMFCMAVLVAMLGAILEGMSNLLTWATMKLRGG